MKNEHACMQDFLLPSDSSVRSFPMNLVQVAISANKNKIFLEQPSPEPKVKVFIPMYEPLEVSECEKCGKVIAEPKELIRMVKI